MECRSTLAISDCSLSVSWWYHPSDDAATPSRDLAHYRRAASLQFLICVVCWLCRRYSVPLSCVGSELLISPCLRTPLRKSLASRRSFGPSREALLPKEAHSPISTLTRTQTTSLLVSFSNHLNTLIIIITNTNTYRLILTHSKGSWWCCSNIQRYLNNIETIPV